MKGYHFGDPITHVPCRDCGTVVPLAAAERHTDVTYVSDRRVETAFYRCRRCKRDEALLLLLTQLALAIESLKPEVLPRPPEEPP